MFGQRGSYPFKWCATLDQKLPYPHYSDPTWDNHQLVFGVEGGEIDSTADSDRLVEWEYKASKFASWSVPEIQVNTPRGRQTYLTTYFQREVSLKQIWGITNRSSGYTVWSYAWRWNGEPFPTKTNRSCFWIGGEFVYGKEANLVLPAELVDDPVHDLMVDFKRYEWRKEEREVHNTNARMNNFHWVIKLERIEELSSALVARGWIRTNDINDVW